MKVDKFIKLKLVKIWEILSQETDEEHPMSTQELLDKLAEMGIPCDRRTVYGDIKALNECGYEICCRRAISNEYYVKNRRFSIAEIRIMIDAVQAAGFITDKKTEEFIDKLADLAGSRRGEALKDNIVAFNKNEYYLVENTEKNRKLAGMKDVEYTAMQIGIDELERRLLNGEEFFTEEGLHWVGIEDIKSEEFKGEEKEVLQNGLRHIRDIIEEKSYEDYYKGRKIKETQDLLRDLDVLTLSQIRKKYFTLENTICE